VPAAFVVGSGATRLLGRGVARLLTDPRQQATTRKELVGQTGVVISSKVDRTFGEVKIPDKTGLVVRVICRIAEGERPIAEGREIVIVGQDEGGHLIVAPLDGDDDRQLRMLKARKGQTT